MPGKEGLAGRVLGILSYHPLFAELWLTASFLQAGGPVPPSRACWGLQGLHWPTNGQRHTLPVMTPWPGGHLLCPLHPLPLPSVSGALFSPSFSFSLLHSLPRR